MELTTGAKFAKFVSPEAEYCAMNGLKKASNAKNHASKILRLALAIGGDSGRALMDELRRSVRRDLDELKSQVQSLRDDVEKLKH